MNNAESLLVRAREAAQRAHCPYSSFHVGAAVRCDDGSVIDGCNVENASYGDIVRSALPVHGRQSGQKTTGTGRELRRCPDGGLS